MTVSEIDSPVSFEGETRAWLVLLRPNVVFFQAHFIYPPWTIYTLTRLVLGREDSA